MLGNAAFHFWYIRVLLVLFLITPILWAVVSRRSLSWVAWPIMLAPLVMSRTGVQISWSTLAYFLGAYTVGMFVGVHYERALALFEKYKRVLLVVVVVTTALLLTMYMMRITRIGPVSMRESVFYVQKLSAAALVLVWFRAREAQIPAWLDSVATHAFAIYFLHVFVLSFFVRRIASLTVNPLSAMGMLTVDLLLIPIAVGGSMAISIAARSLLGRRSRMLVGA